MTNEEIKTFLDTLVADTTKEEAMFGIYQYGGGSDESCVKANKAGLQMFAAEILKASIKSESIIDDKNKNIITVDYNAEWIDEDSDTFIQYIEPLEGTRKKPVPAPPTSYWKNELIKYSLAFVFLIIVVFIITGIVTIVKTIF
jgi:hypothetical protein